MMIKSHMHQKAYDQTSLKTLLVFETVHARTTKTALYVLIVKLMFESFEAAKLFTHDMWYK